MKPKHIYKYNMPGERRYFLGREHRELYDIIALNGNIVSHWPSAVASFLATANKQFFIDPQTYAFQHPTRVLKRVVKKEDGSKIHEFKPSVVKLAKERLGPPFAKVIEEDKPLSPSFFIDDDGNLRTNLLRGLCERVFAFQTSTIYEELDEEEREFMGGDYPFKPVFIIAPYFYLSSKSYLDWIKINLAAFSATKSINTDSETFLALVLSKEALREGWSQIIIDGLSSLGPNKPDGVLLWIDEFEEEALGQTEISVFYNFLKRIRDYTGKIYNNYGGYLSILLSHPESDIKVLDGVGHCINYGESRPVVPVGGGIPLARFYLPALHSRVRFDDALGILRQNRWLESENDYLENVCRCRQCVELISEYDSIDEAFSVYGRAKPVTFRRGPGSLVRLEYPTAEAKQVAARHYLYNKAKEFDDLEKKSLTQLVAEMLKDFEIISGSSGEDIVSHLWYWASGLQSLTGVF